MSTKNINQRKLGHEAGVKFLEFKSTLYRFLAQLSFMNNGLVILAF